MRTLLDLSRYADTFPLPVRRGVRQRIQQARYNLGCAGSHGGTRRGRAGRAAVAGGEPGLDERAQRPFDAERMMGG